MVRKHDLLARCQNDTSAPSTFRPSCKLMVSPDGCGDTRGRLSVAIRVNTTLDQLPVGDDATEINGVRSQMDASNVYRQDGARCVAS